MVATIKDVTETFGSVEPAYTGEPIPRGKYLLEITEALKKNAKADDFPYVELKMTVIDGDYAKRKITDRLFLRTEKAETGEPSQALQMTMATLKAIFGGDLPDDLRAVSKYDPEAIAAAIVNTVVGQQFEVNVGVEKDTSEDGAFGDKNRLQPKRVTR